MSGIIVLLRHGRTGFNKQRLVQGHADVSLDHVGLAQAKKVAHLMKNKAIHHVYTSDLKRASQTADIVGTHLHMLATRSTLLRERRYGELECLRWDEITKKIQNLQSAWSFEHGGWCRQYSIETFSSFKKRLASFLKILQVAHEDENVVVVSHGGAIRMMLSLMQFSSEYVGSLSLKNTGMIVLKRSGKSYTRISLDQLP